MRAIRIEVRQEGREGLQVWYLDIPEESLIHCTTLYLRKRAINTRVREFLESKQTVTWAEEEAG